MPPICPRIQLFGMGLGQLVSIWNFGSSAEACTTIASDIAPANAKVRPTLGIDFALCSGVPYGRPLGRETTLKAGAATITGRGRAAKAGAANRSSRKPQQSSFAKASEDNLSSLRERRLVGATGIEPVTPPV